jgi:hypothetical protein
MGKFWKTGVGAASAALLIGFAWSSSATAQSIGNESLAARVLAQKVEASITGLGCGASRHDFVSAIQSTIAGSGQDPSIVQIALRIAESSPNLCPSAKPALADVDQTVLAALSTEYYATAGGPGPGTPIGPPDPTVAGTSDYGKP